MRPSSLVPSESTCSLRIGLPDEKVGRMQAGVEWELSGSRGLSDIDFVKADAAGHGHSIYMLEDE
jgi:hypothetical protein